MGSDGSELVVIKFGGTSLGTAARVRRAALRVRRLQRGGRAVVVVVSAAADTTDRLVARVAAVASSRGAGARASGRERDRALATGEDLSAALVASALDSLGVAARSLRGGEAGLRADGEHGAGTLTRLRPGPIRALLAQGMVPVVAGFQASDGAGETLTLGRGASDLSAIFIAGALGATECHIVTDVDGVYDRDPHAAAGAVRYPTLEHRALVGLTEGGAEVVQARSARLAAEWRLPLRIYDYRASLRSPVGTLVSSPAAPRVVATTPPRVRVTEREPRTVRVAVAGCGVVGGALVTSILARQEAIAAEQGVRLEIARVLVRRTDVPRPVPAALLTSDVDAFLAADADVVVEALGGLDPAGRVARTTLARGARLVTANKALVAAEGATLAALATAHRGGFDFEAAVGGGIPIVRALRDALAQSPVRQIEGIVNGTSNFVLSRMEAGASFREAVADAQRLGYAEADPTRDLDGTDAAEKLAILAWLAFGVAPHEVHVRRRGILEDADALVATARGAGGRLRLLAECRLTPDGVMAGVAPAVVAADSGFGRTEGVENRIAIDLGWEGRLALCGPGAGAAPTAAALLGDVLRGCTPLPAGRTCRGALSDPPSLSRDSHVVGLLAVEAR